VHSEKLVRSLTAHRVAAVQAELLDRPDVALAAITAHLAQKIFRGNDLYWLPRPENVFAISATDSQSEMRSAAEDMEESAAWAKLQAERTAWAERLPENLEDIFPWLLAQEQATVLHLLTFVVAVTVTGIYGTEPERQSNEALAAGLGTGHDSMVDGHRGFLLQPRLQGACPRGRHRGGRRQCRQPAGRAQKGCRGDRGGTDAGRHGLVARLPAHQHRPDQADRSGCGRHV
jgi:hypothetical protein